MRKSEKQKQILALNNQESNQITRESIKEALFQLMERKPFIEIKMTEIINRSGVSRSALYRNYKKKEDILLEVLDDYIEHIYLNAGDVVENNWEAIFSCIQENKLKLEMLLEAGLEQRILDKLNENIDYATSAGYTNALWNGMIYNAILFYAKSGYPDTKKTSKAVFAAMEVIFESVSKI